MFIPRRFVTALLMGAALSLSPCLAPAANEDAQQSPPPKPHASPAKKASPTPTPAAKKSPAAQKSPEPAKKPAADSKANPSSKKPSPTPAAKTSATPAKKSKKSKAKPKPATQKRRSKQSGESKTSEATPRRHADSDNKEPDKKPEPQKNEPDKKPEKKPEPQRPAPPSPAPSLPTAANVRPVPEPQRSAGQPSADGSVVISKSGIQEEEPAEAPEQEPARAHWWWPFGGGTHYKYLSRSVREAIDDAHVARHRWRYIVVHNSGTRQGSAKAFDYYHKHVRKMPNGLAYHFVIGNGTSTPDGYVEIGPRWINQINGGHVHSDYLNSIALGVCLVGDYNKDRPTKDQLEALDELVNYLRKRVGKTDHHLAIVKPHRDINPPQWPTDCPGDRFPYQWLNGKFDDQ